MMNTLNGAHFSAAELGPWQELRNKGEVFKGKVFLQELLHLTGMEVSLNCLPAGISVPFHHSHKLNEELYIFLKGNGQFRIDGEILDVSAGTVIRVGTQGVRTWRNHSTEDLYYIVIQAAENSLTQATMHDGVKYDTPVTWPE